MNISWDNIDKLEDHYITYLLYKESRTVSQISKIRNLSTSQVNDQLIKAKLEIKSMLKDKVELSKDVIDKFLVLNKNDRLKFMDSLNEERMLDFKRKLLSKTKYNRFKTTITYNMDVMWEKYPPINIKAKEIIIMENKKNKLLILMIVLCIMVPIGGAIAYFRADTSSSNKLSSGNIGIELRCYNKWRWSNNGWRY